MGRGVSSLEYLVCRRDAFGPQGQGRGLSVCPVGPLLHLQGKAELWAGGGWGLGKVQFGVFITGWDFLSLGGIQGLWRKWPPPSGQAFFFLALVLATLAFSRGFISTHRPSWLARRGHDSTTHPQQGQPGPRLPVPLWAGLLEENSTQAFFKTGNCSPCFLEDRNCPHGNCGTKRPH